MPGDVYSQRMKELEGAKEEKFRQTFPDLSRPAPLKQGVDIGANLRPDGEQQPQQPAEMDMGSMFGRLVEGYKGKDSRFEQLTNDYTSLVSGLKQQVDAGMMPEVIAKQKMKQFLMDGRGYFAKHKAKPMDNPETKAVIEGMLEGAMGAEQQAQGAVDPTQSQPQPQPQQPVGGM